MIRHVELNTVDEGLMIRDMQDSGLTATKTLPECMEIEELATQWWKSATLFAANKLRLFDTLQGTSSSADQLAVTYGANAESMARLLDACVALRLLEKRDGRYSNTPVSDHMLVTSSPTYQGDIVAHWADMFAEGKWNRLAESAVSGQRAEPWDGGFYDASRDGFTNYILGMQNWALGGHAAEIARAVDLTDKNHLLDIGGATGAYSAALCIAYPRLKATILDQPRTRPLAERFLAEHNLQDRIAFSEVDITRERFGHNADAILLSNVLHGESLATIVSMLTRAYDALRPTGVVLIQEWFLNGDRTAPPEATLFALHNLLLPGGVVFSVLEMQSLLEHIGFTSISHTELQGMWSVITGQK